MAKRFPVPKFDYEDLKSLDWQAPSPIAAADAARLIDSAAQGDASSYGAYPMAVDDDVFDALDVRGDHRHAALCLLPAGGATMTGRSHAWKIQRLVALQAPPHADAPLLIEWKTPRPMNTRLGPENGVAAPAQALCLVAGNRYSDYWIGNRLMVDNDWRPPSGSGFRVMWSDSDDRDDFHADVVTFAW